MAVFSSSSFFPLWSPHTQSCFRPERWHSLAYYINSRLCLHRGLSGLVVGGWSGVQPSVLRGAGGRKGGREGGRERGEGGESRRGDRVRGIWVKRTVCGQAGWYVLWAGAGAGGDHPYHMFLGVLQRGRLRAKRAQHTQPRALPDALIFFFFSPLLLLLRACRNLHNMPMQTHCTHTHTLPEEQFAHIRPQL